MFMVGKNISTYQYKYCLEKWSTEEAWSVITLASPRKNTTFSVIFDHGTESSFIAMGSEYPKVYIDPIHYENPVAKLTEYSEAMGFSR